MGILLKLLARLISSAFFGIAAALVAWGLFLVAFRDPANIVTPEFLQAAKQLGTTVGVLVFVGLLLRDLAAGIAR
jgi:hypothetical protein